MVKGLPQLQRVDKQQFQLQGMLSFANVVALRAQGRALIDDMSASAFSIDLAQVDYQDSSVLIVCLAWLRDARQHKKNLSFANPPVLLREMAQLSGVDTLLFEDGLETGN